MTRLSILSSKKESHNNNKKNTLIFSNKHVINCLLNHSRFPSFVLPLIHASHKLTSCRICPTTGTAITNKETLCQKYYNSLLSYSDTMDFPPLTHTKLPHYIAILVEFQTNKVLQHLGRGRDCLWLYCLYSKQQVPTTRVHHQLKVKPYIYSLLKTSTVQQVESMKTKS